MPPPIEIPKIMTRLLGLNSGSSFDSIDAVLVEIENAADGYPGRPKFIDGIAYEWPADVAEMVLRSFDNRISIFELCRLNYVAGAVYAQAALALMKKAGIEPDDLEAIGYDGQTIYQEPPDHDGMRKLK